MEEKKINKFAGAINKLFGGVSMSWLAVILFAVGTAALTAIFLLFPIFKNTSFELMGVTFEAWILFAVIIMANCKKPLESALKVFVFFLISQPLIYLIQVPFSALGWGLFIYYRHWFYWTLLTFPMAFVGWYITKKNWLSVLIFAPIFAYLGVTLYGCAGECAMHFPHLLIAALFCLLQLVLYIIAFFPDIKQKIVGILIALIPAIVVMITTPQVNLAESSYLPDQPAFSAEAAITVEDSSIADVQLVRPEEGAVFIKAQAYGRTMMTVIDGETTMKYLLEVYDDNGFPRTKITLAGQDESVE